VQGFVTVLCRLANKTRILEPEVHIRSLGLTVLRGPTITLLSPVDGLEEIANPFMAQE